MHCDYRLNHATHRSTQHGWACTPPYPIPCPEDEKCAEFEEAIHGVRSDPAEVIKKLETLEQRKAKAVAKKMPVVQAEAHDTEAPADDAVQFEAPTDIPEKEPQTGEKTHLSPQQTEAINKSLKTLFDNDCEVAADNIDELLTCMSDEQKALFDSAEVQDGVRRGIQSDGDMTFRQVCKLMTIPCELWDAYAEWLSASDRPGIILRPDQFPRAKGSRIPKGVKLPCPAGLLWKKLRDNAAAAHSHIPKLHQELTSYATYGEEKAVFKGRQFLQSAQVLKNNERMNRVIIKSMRATIRAKDSHPGILPAPKGIGGVLKHQNVDAWIQALLKEIDDVTEMGSVTHLHTWQDLIDAGIDVDKVPPVYSHIKVVG